MARQLYCEQRGVDIGVATYMKQKAETEKVCMPKEPCKRGLVYAKETTNICTRVLLKQKKTARGRVGAGTHAKVDGDVV